MTFRAVLVGRPNVGKSAIFNRVLGRRRSLVHGLPGMTRDVVEEEAALPDGRTYVLVDTGGFDPSDREAIPAAVRERALAEIDRADLALLVVDASAGVLPADREAARALRRAGRDTIVIANKIDRREGAEGEGEAYALGFPEVLGFSAEHAIGRDELLEAIAARVPPAEEPPSGEAHPENREIAVAIVGRPNVGKSSLLNALLGFERTIVSETAGTTRDSIDALAEREGRVFRFIDTAGIRRKAKTEEGPEVLSVVAARKRIERCDVALLVFDASEGATAQDAAIAADAVEKGRGIVLIANKWDLAGPGAGGSEFEADVYRRFAFARFAPLLRVSARTGRAIEKIPATIARVADNRGRRIPTAAVNRTLGEEARSRPPKGSSGRPLKIYYAAQTGTRPPSFTLVASRGEELYFSDARRLENTLRRSADFAGVPIRLRVAARKQARSS
jgi:GTP-binding protein